MIRLRAFGPLDNVELHFISLFKAFVGPVGCSDSIGDRISCVSAMPGLSDRALVGSSPTPKYDSDKC